jgi:glutamine---fructose-6-phosphate transaminase (isomerizing)
MTKMFDEAFEAAGVVRAQLAANTGTMTRIGARLRRSEPPLIVTCARGSSDHAATYAKYLFESRIGIFTASAAPSINSVYGKQMKVDGGLCLFISQSGASPDLLAVARAAKRAGGYVVACVNVADSPLAAIADDVVELHAGSERSVAATKSFIASLAAVLQLVAHWQDDDELHAVLASLPDRLRDAWECDWSPALDVFAASPGLFVLGRGIGLGIAQEAALKLKEVCGLHAEAFSAAEVLHGPIAIAGRAFPVLVFAQHDQTHDGISRLADRLAENGITVVGAGLEGRAAVGLPTIAGHPAIEPLLEIQSFYRMADSLSVRLGLDPDHPPFLSKVTATV